MRANFLKRAQAFMATTVMASSLFYGCADMQMAWL
jgi:hypothetical protein